LYQAINFLRNIPRERITSDPEIRAFYYELKAIFEKAPERPIYHRELKCYE
jgi:hypothetical protein